MKVAYTLTGSYYQPSDIELALQCAEAVAQKANKPVKILLEGKAQYAVLLGVNGLNITGSSFTYNSLHGDIITRLQYQGSKGDIAVTVCPTIQLLQKIQDTGISLLVVVPEMTVSTNIYHWLDLNSAIDIMSQQVLNGIGLPATGIKRAIGYLIDYCQRNTVDFTHITVQAGEMANVVNTIKKKGISANEDEIVKYCLQRDLTLIEAEILAKAFCKKTCLPMRGNPNYDLYWKAIDDKKWE